MNMKTAISPRSIKKVVLDGLRLFKNSFLDMQVINLSSLLLMVPFIAALTLFIAIKDGTIDHQVPLSGISVAIIFFVVFFLIMLTQSLMFYGLYQFRQTQMISFKKVFGFCLRRLHYILLGALLYALSVMVGTIAFVIPGIILAILFMYVIPCILFDDKNGWTCLASSARLVWPHWFRTAGILMIANMMSVGALLVISMFTGIIAGIFSFSEVSTIGILLQGIGAIIIAVLQFVIFSLILAVIIEQYYDLKVRQALKAQPDKLI